MVNIAYLIWLEDLYGPIIRTQVIDLLKEIKKKKTTKQGIFLNEIEELANILSSNMLPPEEKSFEF